MGAQHILNPEPEKTETVNRTPTDSVAAVLDRLVTATDTVSGRLLSLSVLLLVLSVKPVVYWWNFIVLSL